MKILVVLQCAYGTTAQRRKELQQKELWLQGLWNSHTGRRLRNMLPDNAIIDIINSTPRIGSKSSDYFPPNLEYIQTKIDIYSPDKILACGNVAQEALSKLNIAYISAPHPAWRQLSNIKISEIKEELVNE